MARVNAKESVNTSSKDWMNLMCAIQDENIPLVKILLQRRIGVNMKDERGWSFLLQATNTRSANACYEIIKELLAKGIEVDSQDEHGWTALMIASLKGYHQTIKLLLEYMANVNIRNVDGWSALMFASLKGKNEAAKVLLEYGSNVNEQSIEGQSALMIASRYGHTKTVKLLLDHRARVNDKDSAGWCALMFASRNGHIESVKLLLGLRCNREQPILLNHHYRTDINMQNNSGCTSLIIASQNRQTNIAKCLLQYGADTKIKDNFGQSATDYATKNGHTELVNLLMCREHVYDHLPNITMTRNSTDPDYDVVIPRHRQQSAPSVNALHLTTQTNKSTCQQVRHSEYNHLPHDEMCLHSTKRNEYDDLVHRPTQRSTFNAQNTNSPSCTQSRRHSIEADRGSFPRPRHSGYDHLTVILTPRSDHALDFENCAISNEHINMISGSINDWDELVAKQLGLSSDDITTIKKKYPNIKPKLQM